MHAVNVYNFRIGSVSYCSEIEYQLMLSNSVAILLERQCKMEFYTFHRLQKRG